MCSPGRVAFSLSPNKALRGYHGPALRGSGHGRLGGRLLEGPPLAALAALVLSPDLPVYAVQPVLELVGGQHRDGADDGAAHPVRQRVADRFLADGAPALAGAAAGHLEDRRRLAPELESALQCPHGGFAGVRGSVLLR